MDIQKAVRGSIALLDVALRLECGRHGLMGAVLPGPPGVALASGLPQRSDAGAVLSTPGAAAAQSVGITGFFDGDAAGLGVPGMKIFRIRAGEF